MRKKILGGIAVLAIAAVVAINVNLNANSNNLSDLSLANVEALASGEVSAVGCCPNGGACIITVNGVVVYTGLGEHPCGS